MSYYTPSCVAAYCPREPPARTGVTGADDGDDVGGNDKEDSVGEGHALWVEGDATEVFVESVSDSKDALRDAAPSPSPSPSQRLAIPQAPPPGVRTSTRSPASTIMVRLAPMLIVLYVPSG